MRFLFRLILFGIVIMLAFRFLRALTAPRQQSKRDEPPQAPPSALREDRIQDATFTDIADKPKP